MTNTSEVKEWLETTGLIPSCEFGICIIDKIRTEWETNTFVCILIIDGQATLWNGTSGFEIRGRGSTYNSQYYQARPITNGTDELIVKSGDIYTIFYQ